MSVGTTDLWPADIECDDVRSPAEILREQARLLSVRTNGILTADVTCTKADDRVVQSFEIFAPRIDSRVNLFSIEHRAEFPYPVAVNSPDESLPNYLQARYYKPGLAEQLSMSPIANAMSKGKWVDNPRVATSPSEFVDRVSKILSSASVKASLLSLIARSTDKSPLAGDAVWGPDSVGSD